jgi:hypothetical protein
MRWDMQEKQWGNTDWRNGVKASGQDNTNSRPQTTAATASNIQENIEVEQGYVSFKTAIGQFNVGYQSLYQWGLDWMNTTDSGPRASFITQVGPIILNAHWDKLFEGDFSGVAAPNYQKTIDADNDAYGLFGIYKWDGGDAGLLLKHYLYKAKKPEAAGGYVQRLYLAAPYFRATIGPIYIEGELQHFWGKLFEFESPTLADISLDTWAGYIMGRYNFGPAYASYLFSYTSGDDFDDPTKVKTTMVATSHAWNPVLIVANWEYGVAHPSRSNYNAAPKSNMIINQINGGFKPVPKLDLFASLTYMTVADKHYAKNKEASSNVIGWEFDITATYKIFDQLTYMVGFGYLWAGDNWKDNPATIGGNTGLAAVPGNVGNNYLLLNKLELIF